MAFNGISLLFPQSLYFSLPHSAYEAVVPKLYSPFTSLWTLTHLRFQATLLQLRTRSSPGVQQLSSTQIAELPRLPIRYDLLPDNLMHLKMARVFNPSTLIPLKMTQHFNPGRI